MMQKAELQQANVQNQQAARQTRGTGVESPQSEEIAQLESMIESSPQIERLGGLAAMMNAGSAMAAQRKLRDLIANSPRQQAAQGQVQPAMQMQTMANSSTGARPGMPLQIQNPKAESAASTVIQAKIKSPFEPPPQDKEILKILEQVQTYNSIGGYRFTFPLTERQQALDQLALIERLIYTWFGNQRSFDLDSNPVNINMKVLMNLVLVERQSLVGISINSNDDAPPVANLADMNPLVQKKVTQIWRQLLDGDGIQIQGPKAFQIKVLTDFSRLLETEMGRTLTGGIIETGKGLLIHPTSMAKGKFVAKPVSPETEGLVESETHEDFVLVDVTGMEESQRLRLLQHVRGANKGSPGMSVQSENGVRHFRFGKGSGSTLPVPDDSMDAMADSSSRMANPSGYEVIAPTFINMGHELGHVLRSAQGISAAGEGGSALLEHSFQNPEGDIRSEEFFNIGGVENRLRKESGLMERHGHGNLYSHWATEGMNTIYGMMDQITEQLKRLEAESAAAIRLRGLNKELNALIEPFQALAKGKAKIAPLLRALNTIKVKYYFGD